MLDTPIHFLAKKKRNLIQFSFQFIICTGLAISRKLTQRSHYRLILCHDLPSMWHNCRSRESIRGISYNFADSVMSLPHFGLGNQSEIHWSRCTTWDKTISFRKVIIRNYIKRCFTELLAYPGRWHVVWCCHGSEKRTNTRLVWSINGPESIETCEPRYCYTYCIFVFCGSRLRSLVNTLYAFKFLTFVWNI